PLSGAKNNSGLQVGEKAALIPWRPLVRALGAAPLPRGSRLLRRELGWEMITHHAERDDRREAVLRRPLRPSQTGIIYRPQGFRSLHLSDVFGSPPAAA